MRNSNASQNGAQPQVVYVQAEKKPWYKRAGCITGLVLVILLIAIIGGCSVITGKAVDEVDKDLNTERTVTYEITGDAQDATVIYNVGETESAQDTGVSTGWSKDVAVKGIFGASLTASNGMNDTGAITCKISANGQVLTENTANGEFATATCSVDSTQLSKAFEE